jgi:hypothetical protein
MDIKNLILGILLLVFGIILLVYDNNKKNKIGMLKTIYLNLNITRVGMVIIGLYVIFREMKKFLFLVLIIFLNSCSVLKVETNRKLQEIDLDKNIILNIKNYKNQYGSESIVLISFKNKVASTNNTYYLTRISNLSTICQNYLSSYSLIDGLPVIISSKKDGLIGYKNYPNNFIDLISKKLNNDLLLNAIKKSKTTENHWEIELKNNLISNHSKVWKIHKNNINKNYNRKHSEINFLVENNQFSFIQNYKVLNGGIDERTIND